MTQAISLQALRGDGPTRLVLGTMNFGKRTSVRDAHAILERAVDRGITCLDTANAYVDGESERIVGRFIEKDRARVRVATKVGVWKREGLSPARILVAIDESLERLRTDHVDVYYLHVPDRKTPIDETLGAMKEVLASKKALAWGVSNYASWQILEMCTVADRLDMPRPVIAQQLMNLVHRELEIEYLAFRRAYPIHLTIYNPLAGGLLTHRHVDTFESGSRLKDNPLYARRYATDAMRARVMDLRSLAERAGLSLVEMAYAYLANKREVDSILVGPGSVAHLDQAIDAVLKELAPELAREIDGLEAVWTGTDTHYPR
jgi:aryl-alcohol dehydrogenase-like predicted oxidoreductase